MSYDTIIFRGIIFMLLFPIIQLTCFYLAIGKTPTNLEIGVYSGEVESYGECFNDSLVTVYKDSENDSCLFHKLSCRYIRELGDDVATRKYYSSEADALSDAKKATTVGYLHFAQNFSESILSVLEDGIHSSDGAVDHAELSIHIDMTGKNLDRPKSFKSIKLFLRSTSGVLHAAKAS